MTKRGTEDNNTCSGDVNMFAFVCDDGVVEEEVGMMRMSGCVASYIDAFKDTNTDKQWCMPMKKVSFTTMKLVCEYCRHCGGMTPDRDKYTREQALDEWETTFFGSQSFNSIVEITQAAHYLELPSFVNACSKYIYHLLKEVDDAPTEEGKKELMQKNFGITKHYSEEELVEMRKDPGWVFPYKPPSTVNPTPAIEDGTNNNAITQ